MRSPRQHLIALSGTLLTATVVAGLPAAAASAAPAPSSSAGSSATARGYQPEMVHALAVTLGVSDRAATARLDREAAQQGALGSLDASGVHADGAFFDDAGTLTVNVADAAQAATVRRAGLTGRVPQRGQRALQAVQRSLDAAAARRTPTGVTSWSVDLPSDTVLVSVADGRGAAAKAFLAAAARHGAAVRVVHGVAASPQAVVYPGSKMTLNATTEWCSVGYGARDRSGNQVLVTAGHCVESLPTLRFDGTAFAKGTRSRFVTGGRSRDMGIARVSAGSSIASRVGTWGNGSAWVVSGSRRAAVGASLCKSGATSGWTCGKVKSYNASVNYGNTFVTDLGTSSVCTAPGDSGGAYISGYQAQGMTSGGPTGQQCTGGVNSPGSSFFQPLDDALSFYGLTLNTN